MKKVIPYKRFSNALKALDNGGRFYNFFTKAEDNNVTRAELAKVAGVHGNKQLMFLYLEMALAELDEGDREALGRTLSKKLQAARAQHAPQHLLPSEADKRGVPSKTAIITGYPRFVEDKTEFSGFIMIPIMIGKSMTFMFIPIMDQFDIYELSDEVSDTKTFIANVRGSARLPVDLCRFGGVLKETAQDKEGKQKDRLLLEAAYYTPLPGRALSRARNPN